jgi:hypothetical protein
MEGRLLKCLCNTAAQVLLDDRVKLTKDDAGGTNKKKALSLSFFCRRWREQGCRTATSATTIST